MYQSWSMPESNRRPRACWARALPTELIPLFFKASQQYNISKNIIHNYSKRSNYSLPTHYYYIYTIETHQPYQTQITIKPFSSTRISYYIYSIYHNIYLKTKDKNCKLIVTTRPAWDWYMAHNLFKCIPFSN